jgi:hypothetical protein
MLEEQTAMSATRITEGRQVKGVSEKEAAVDAMARMVTGLNIGARKLAEKQTRVCDNTLSPAGWEEKNGGVDDPETHITCSWTEIGRLRSCVRGQDIHLAAALSACCAKSGQGLIGSCSRQSINLRRQTKRGSMERLRHIQDDIRDTSWLSAHHQRHRRCCDVQGLSTCRAAPQLASFV